MKATDKSRPQPVHGDESHKPDVAALADPGEHPWHATVRMMGEAQIEIERLERKLAQMEAKR